MKSTLLLYSCIIAILFIGCADDFDKEFEERRNAYIGFWNVNESYQQYLNDSLEIEFNKDIYLEIRNDGFAYDSILNSPLSFPDTTEWFYQYDPERIVFIERVSGAISNSKVYEVIKTGNSTMEWSTSYNQSHIDGNERRIEIVRSLTRI